MKLPSLPTTWICSPCAGFRMTAHYGRCHRRQGRRPKASREGDRDEGMCAGAAGADAVSPTAAHCHEVADQRRGVVAFRTEALIEPSQDGLCQARLPACCIRCQRRPRTTTAGFGTALPSQCSKIRHYRVELRTCRWPGGGSGPRAYVPLADFKLSGGPDRNPAMQQAVCHPLVVPSFWPGTGGR
jgi:hypothetical protein